MSGRPNPPDRSDSQVPPVMRRSNEVPVTPGIGSGQQVASPTSEVGEGDYFGGPGSEPSYFSEADRKLSAAAEAASTPQADAESAAARSVLGDKDGLRRTSTVGSDAGGPGVRLGSGRRESVVGARSTNMDLHLSGNIISATITVPYALKYRKGKDWELKPRRGQSALFDSFHHLSSPQSGWNHTVVAWTGEIDAPVDMLSPPDTPPATTHHLPPLNSLSAPVPIDGMQLPSPPLADGGLWIPREDMARLENQLAHEEGIRTVPVWLADDDDVGGDGIRLKDQGRWRRYAEGKLYTLLHYKQHEPTDGRKERIQWADYYRMNQKFANRIMEIYKPGDIVVVHDYYLMLLPSMLRQRAQHMYIAFFLHCPFPSSEFVRCLSRRKEVLEGVLGSNLVGFQSFGYSRHFSSCCTRILGFPSDTAGVDTYGARVQVGVFPIGIDAAKVESLAFSPAVTESRNKLREMYAGKKLIVGRDRLDTVRGVAQKLMAFERFLESYPEWRERVVLMQVTSPSVIEDAAAGSDETKIAMRVNELVGRINGLYGSLGFSPVQHYPQYLSQAEYFALLRAGDVALITSVRDGMNTTSLEYVVCQRDDHGPLILSEFSGTAASLRDAIQINPWDLQGVADSLYEALSMSAERRMEMQQSLYNHVTTRTVQTWIGQFLRRLIGVLASSKDTVATPLLDRSALLLQYRAAGAGASAAVPPPGSAEPRPPKRRLLMFDYDGTLTPIVREPSAAIPSERILRALEQLAADPRNAVWIISGRDQEFLAQHLGHIAALGFSAEHGSFVRLPGGGDRWENLAEKLDMGWQKEVIEVFEKYTDRVPGSFIERKRCALTWHYRQADPELGQHMSRECQTELETGVAKRWDVEVMPGKANLEVRPTFINKGEIAKRLVRMYNDPTSDEFAGTVAEGTNHGQLQFVLCMGDDFTDEDMFRALGGLSVVPENPHLKPAAGAGKGSATDSSNNDGLSANHVFSVTVGPSTKPTLARWHLLEPADVIECVALLAGVAGDADPTSTTASSTNGAYANGKVSNRDEEEELSSAATTNASRPAERRLGEVNLGVLSAAEGRIPQDQKEVGMDV